MAVSAYASSGALALSAFRTIVVGASASVSMSKLVARNATTSTTTTDIQYYGTNVPWNETGVVGTNNSIPTRTSGNSTPAISISDFHGAFPWFWTFRDNEWFFSSRYREINKGIFEYDHSLMWDNLLVYTDVDNSTQYTTITTGGYTYYKGQAAASGRPAGGWPAYTVSRIGRD